MVSWNSIFPNGNVSVKANEVIGQDNTTYIETILGNQVVGTNPNPNTAKDHFWDISSEFDGRHRFMQSPAFVDSLGEPAIPEFGSSMAGVHFLKTKTSIEAPDLQKPEPFHKTTDGSNDQILQLGFRALISFNGTIVDQTSVKYSHNIAAWDVNPFTSGIVNGGIGQYTIRFSVPLPTINYIVFGSGTKTTAIGQVKQFSVAPLARGSMLTTELTVIFTNLATGVSENPEYGMIAIVGG